MIARIAKIAGIARIENRGSVWTLLAAARVSAGVGSSAGWRERVDKVAAGRRCRGSFDSGLSSQ